MGPFGALIYRHGGNLYNFAGLRAFKDKLRPDWRRYLAAPSSLPPLLPLADAPRLIAGRAPFPQGRSAHDQRPDGASDEARHGDARWHDRAPQPHGR